LQSDLEGERKAIPADENKAPEPAESLKNEGGNTFAPRRGSENHQHRESTSGKEVFNLTGPHGHNVLTRVRAVASAKKRREKVDETCHNRSSAMDHFREPPSENKFTGLGKKKTSGKGANHRAGETRRDQQGSKKMLQERRGS